MLHQKAAVPNQMLPNQQPHPITNAAWLAGHDHFTLACLHQATPDRPTPSRKRGAELVGQALEQSAP